jgi:alkanesulfonate monooxygenase SsuD/methylene tetrahydromethanopterin reductase-like flavin-dependent oxidoreductase (luciferase family)
MWTQDAPSFEGKHFTIREAAAPPLPSVVPPVCIGASGEQIGLPLVGRQADMWNSFMKTEEDWTRKRDIVHASAEKAGRNPTDIAISTTLEVPLPTTDAESAALLERLTHLNSLGISYFVMDFGHPPSPEPIHRFVEQVMNPLKHE